MKNGKKNKESLKSLSNSYVKVVNTINNSDLNNKKELVDLNSIPKNYLRGKCFHKIVEELENIINIEKHITFSKHQRRRQNKLNTRKKNIQEGFTLKKNELVNALTIMRSAHTCEKNKDYLLLTFLVNYLSDITISIVNKKYVLLLDASVKRLLCPLKNLLRIFYDNQDFYTSLFFLEGQYPAAITFSKEAKRSYRNLLAHFVSILSGEDITLLELFTLKALMGWCVPDIKEMLIIKSKIDYDIADRIPLEVETIIKFYLFKKAREKIQYILKNKEKYNVEGQELKDLKESIDKSIISSKLVYEKGDKERRERWKKWITKLEGALQGVKEGINPDESVRESVLEPFECFYKMVKIGDRVRTVKLSQEYLYFFRCSQWEGNENLESLPLEKKVPVLEYKMLWLTLYFFYFRSNLFLVNTLNHYLFSESGLGYVFNKINEQAEGYKIVAKEIKGLNFFNLYGSKCCEFFAFKKLTGLVLVSHQNLLKTLGAMKDKEKTLLNICCIEKQYQNFVECIERVSAWLYRRIKLWLFVEYSASLGIEGRTPQELMSSSFYLRSRKDKRKKIIQFNARTAGVSLILKTLMFFNLSKSEFACRSGIISFFSKKVVLSLLQLNYEIFENSGDISIRIPKLNLSKSGEVTLRAIVENLRDIYKDIKICMKLLCEGLQLLKKNENPIALYNTVRDAYGSVRKEYYSSGRKDSASIKYLLLEFLYARFKLGAQPKFTHVQLKVCLYLGLVSIYTRMELPDRARTYMKLCLELSEKFKDSYERASETKNNNYLFKKRKKVYKHLSRRIKRLEKRFC